MAFSPALLVCSVAALALMLLIHVVLWRLLGVRRQVLWLFGIFLGLPTLAYIVALGVAWRPVEATIVYLFVISLTCSYIIIYPTIQAESPTVVMVRLLHRHNASGGLSRAEVLAAMRSDEAFDHRLTDLRDNGLIRREGGDGPVRLSGFGRAVAAFFYYYRRVLGLPLGRG
jgi:hypothetical protein